MAKLVRKSNVSKPPKMFVSGVQDIRKQMPLPIHSGMMRKEAQMVVTTPVELRNPLMNVENWFFPYDRLELNRWIRYYKKTHPLIGNALDLHSTLPWAKFQLIGVDSDEVREFYQDMADQLNLFKLFVRATDFFFSYGEAIPFAHWDDKLQAFDYVVLQDPDMVEILKDPFSGDKKYRRIIDNQMREFYSSDDELKQQMVDKWPVDVANSIDAVEGKLFIHDFYMDHIVYSEQEDGRGTSLVLGVLKDLLYEDQLRKAQYVTATRRISPLGHWEVGDLGSDPPWIPDEEYLQRFQNQLAAMGNEPGPDMVTPPGFKFNALGISERFLPLVAEFEAISKRMMIRLFTSEAAISGTGPNFATASVAMRYNQARYDYVVSEMLSWAERKLFLPVAIANNFFKPEKKDMNGHNVVVGSLYKKRMYKHYIKPLMEEGNDLRARLQDKFNGRYAGLAMEEIQGKPDVEKDITRLWQVFGALSKKMAMAGSLAYLPEYAWKGKVNLLTDEGKREFLTKLMDKEMCSVKTVAEVFGVDVDELGSSLAVQFGMDYAHTGERIFDKTWRENKMLELEGEPELDEKKPFGAPPIGKGLDLQERLPEEPFDPERQVPGGEELVEERAF